MCTDFPTASVASAPVDSELASNAWGTTEPASMRPDIWQPNPAARPGCDELSDTTCEECEPAGGLNSPAEEAASALPCAMLPLAEKPVKARKPAVKSAMCKPQRQCQFEHCPSPMHSSKWRVVTRTTVAGGRDWQKLLGMTLCDSCYSTYRKHGTFIRSVRTPEGWARFDHSAQAHILNKPSKKRVAPAPPRAAKRARPSPPMRIDIDTYEDAGRPKRERRPSSKLRDLYTCDESLEADHDEDASTPTTTKANHAAHHHVWGGEDEPQSYCDNYLSEAACQDVAEEVFSPSSDDQPLDYENEFLYNSIAPELPSFGVPFGMGCHFVEPSDFMA